MLSNQLIHMVFLSEIIGYLKQKKPLRNQWFERNQGGTILPMV